MAQAGVGVDMLEISRVRRARARRPRLVERGFSAEERAWCERGARPEERYAACFAAHGAVARALGLTGRGSCGLDDVSVGHEGGQVRVTLSGRALEAAEAAGVREVALSLSYTREVAVANAVAVTAEVRPEEKREPDAGEELRRSFRRARSVIDELERIQETGLAGAVGAASGQDAPGAREASPEE